MPGRFEARVKAPSPRLPGTSPPPRPPAPRLPSACPPSPPPARRPPRRVAAMNPE